MGSRKLTLRGPTREELDQLRGGTTVIEDGAGKGGGADSECKFCGVSYLVRSKVRALDNQLRQVQDELAARSEELEAVRNGQSGVQVGNQGPLVADCKQVGALSIGGGLASPEVMMSRDAYMRGIACEQAKAQIEYENKLTNQSRKHNAEISAVRRESTIALKSERAAAELKLKRSTRELRARATTLKAEAASLRALITREVSSCQNQLQDTVKSLLMRYQASVSQRRKDETERLRVAESSWAAGKLELETGRRELEGIELSLATEQLKVQGLESDLRRAKAEAAAWKTQSLEQGESGGRVAAQLTKKDAEVTALRAKLKVAQAEACKVAEQGAKDRAELEVALSLERQKVSQAQEDAAAQLDDRVQSGTVEMRARLAREFESKRKELDAAHQEEMEHRVRKIEQERDALVADLDDARASIAELETKAESGEKDKELTETVAKLEARVQQMQFIHKADTEERERAANRRLDEVREQFEHEREALGAQLDQMDQEREALVAQLDMGAKEASEREEELNAEMETRAEHAAEVQKNLDAAVAKAETAANSEKFLHQQIAFFVNKIKEHKQEASDAQKEVERLESQVEDTQRSRDDALLKAAAVREELDAKIDASSKALRDDKLELELLLERTKQLAQDKEAELESKVHELLKELGAARNQLKTKDQVVETKPQQPIQESLDPEGIEILEGHMIKLSNLVRQKDAEIRVLQETVHRQCQERTDLLDKLQSH